jgi:serine/threonine-protein kinase
MDNTATKAGLRADDVIDGRYRVIKTVGEGGMGTVYLAEHALIKRRVAVKVLHPELASDVKVVERFMNEARAAGTLGHTNIVESTDMGFIDGVVPYIVFEYLEGSLLTDEIYRLGAVPVRRAVKIAQQIASALQAAHAAGIIHRDLKADNIFLTDRGESLDHVKVLDFGISKFLEATDEKTRRGMIMGTPEFMAPEQITTPDHVDTRSDVYALGVILYEMLAGKRPFTNDDPRTLLHRICHTEAPPIDRPEIPRGLHDLVFKLLEKDPDDRIQTMEDVEAVLDLYATHGDGGTARPTRSMRVPTPRPTTDAIEIAASIRGRAPTPVPARQSQVLPPMGRDTPWPGDMKTPWPGMDAVSLGQPPAHRTPKVLYGLVALGVCVGAVGLYIGLRKADPPPQQVQVAPAPAPAPAAALPPPAAPQKVEVIITADAPNARVTFRRRLASTPFTITVNPTDIVELVEVSAPGKKTLRYWLTIDRPTKLHARLPRGSGMLEATEEQTLVALGEAEIAAPVAVAAAAPEPAKGEEPAKSEEPSKAAPAKADDGKADDQAIAVAARDDRRSRSKDPAHAKPTPRRIGKAAAEDAATPAETPAAAAVAPEPPAPAAKPEAAIARPVAPAEETKPKPIDPGLLEKSMVNSVAGKYRGEVRACYEQGKKANPKLKGDVTVSMTVDASGAVSRPQVSSTLGNPVVAACILKSVGKWKFPARPGGSAANASYKFALQ